MMNRGYTNTMLNDDEIVFLSPDSHPGMGVDDLKQKPFSKEALNQKPLNQESMSQQDTFTCKQEDREFSSDKRLRKHNSKRAKPTSRQTVAPTIGTVRFAAMSYLAMREHSKKELIQKLSRRFEESLLVEQAVQQLSDESLQCDDRFAEAFTKMRKRRGQGPIRIAYELQQKGISPELIERYVYSTLEEEWITLAREVCDRKYNQTSDDHDQRVKQMRFLQYRGFSSDTIRQLWR